jgi:hypothetical protein
MGLLSLLIVQSNSPFATALIIKQSSQILDTVTTETAVLDFKARAKAKER